MKGERTLRRRLITIGFMTAAVCSFAFSQDAPDGFASVSGKGLNATTGGAAGQTVTVTTFADLKKYAESATPYTILIKGKIPAPSKGDADFEWVNVDRYGAYVTGVAPAAGIRSVKSAAAHPTPSIRYGNGTVQLSAAGGGSLPAALASIRIDGRVIHRTRVSVDGNMSLTVSGLSQGVYFATVEGGGRGKSRKNFLLLE